MSNTNDPIVQTKTCPISGNEFSITQKDMEFYDKISPTFAGQKFQIPTPTLSPDERQRRRLAFRNERNLYRRTCDASGKQIISMYSPDKPYKVYDQKIWWSDSRDGLDYGRAFDFSKSFTENYKSLSLTVPIPSMYNYFAENSDYCNCANYQKNCYLTSASSRNEQCMYCAYTTDSLNCLDAFMTFESEYCYMTVDCEKSYKLLFASNCRNCTESYFLTNCTNCNHCFDCEGLENATYCFQNQQLTKEEYLLKIENRKLGDFMHDWSLRKQKNTILFSDSCTGAHIRNSKNAHHCYDTNNIEDSKYCTWFLDSKSCMDIYSWGQNSELCYNSVAIGDNTYGIIFSSNIDTNSKNIMYSTHCRSSSDCFGCIGLSEQQYCIFNKQYTKEEYEKTVAKIITHMQETGERGEFFDPSLSPFGYNETVAQEYYPSTKDEITQNGYKRSNYEVPTPVSDRVIQGQDLPESIKELQDDILHFAIACEVTGKLFRLQPQELAFYRKHNIPVPRKHPDQRHLERLALRK